MCPARGFEEPSGSSKPLTWSRPQGTTSSEVESYVDSRPGPRAQPPARTEREPEAVGAGISARLIDGRKVGAYSSTLECPSSDSLSERKRPVNEPPVARLLANGRHS